MHGDGTIKIIERTVHKHWTGTIEDRNIDC